MPTAPPKMSRKDLIALLNEDLAREYQAIIAYVVYSQVLTGAEYMAIADELELHAAQELAHALTIAKHIDYLGGMPTATPKPVKLSEDPKTMLRADLANEAETIRNYRERLRQCEAMSEFGIAEDIREILRQEQEHLTDLATALGEDAPTRRSRHSLARLSNPEILPEPAALAERDANGRGDELREEGGIEPFALLHVGDGSDSILAGRHVLERERSIARRARLLNAPRSDDPVRLIGRKEDDEILGRGAIGAVGDGAEDLGRAIGHRHHRVRDRLARPDLHRPIEGFLAVDGGGPQPPAALD